MCEKILIVLLLFLSTSSLAFSEEFTLNFSSSEIKWKTQNTSAYISAKASYVDGTTLNHNFIVSFDKNNSCLCDFGYSVLTGIEYGKLIKTSFIEKDYFKMYVDDVSIYNDKLLLAKYPNGQELSFMADDKIISSLSKGNLLKIVIDNSITVLFNLENSEISIKKAQDECLSTIKVNKNNNLF